MDWIISVGDAISQVLGRFIPVHYDGEWHTFTRTSNESISGAANWHSQNGRFGWVEKIIDVVALLFGEKGHCLKARKADRSRAGRLLATPII